MLKNYLPIRVFFKLTNFCYYRNNKNVRQREQQVNNGAIVFYDYDCPLCRTEMQRLKSLDQEDRLNLLNMNSPIFDEQYWGVSREEASRALHVLTAEKIWLVGMPAIRHVYSQVGLGWLMTPSGWPVFSKFADLAYRCIAPNRILLSRWLGMGKVKSECTDKVCSTKNYNYKA